MEYKKGYTGPIVMACLFVAVVGLVHFIISTISIARLLAYGAISDSELGRAGLMLVLALIGASQIVAGIIGLLSLKNERFRPIIKWVGYCLLLMSVTYVITTALIRGFQMGTVFSVALAIMFLSIVKPNPPADENQVLPEKEIEKWPELDKDIAEADDEDNRE